MEKLNYTEVLRKKPFLRTLPGGIKYAVPATRVSQMSEPEDNLQYSIVTQSDFLREEDPTSHAIYDNDKFPDVMKRDPDTGKWYRQPVTRVAFAFQRLIAIKQTVTLCGNDLQMELAEENGKAAEADVRMLNTARSAWLELSCEVSLFECIHSLKTTGDAAFVAYLKDGKAYTKTLSFRNGDKLYPHFDSITGELNLFARRYTDVDEDGVAVTNWVEVWDNEFYSLYKEDVSGSSLVSGLFRAFGIGGYKLVEKKPHLFPFIPVAYVRDDAGACWSVVQNLIERYEESFSYFCENNKAFAFPIFYTKGDGVDIQGDLNGSVKAISMPEGGEAGFLAKQDVSVSYNTQLKELYKLIYELSFAVQPPELKSGDLPGVALKLLYSPAIEKAIYDAQFLQPFINTMLRISLYAYGIEHACATELMRLKINAWIEPYVHQNDSELINNLAASVQNGFLSRQTASERIPKYAKTGEWERIIREEKEEQQRDLLGEMRSEQVRTEEAIEREAAIISLKGGQDVNTGGGAGRPNRTGIQWDENGNYEGRNGWRRGEEYKR